MMKETSIRAKLFGANNILYVIVTFVCRNFYGGVVTDSDLRYIDRRGNLLRNRAEFSTSNILTFLGHNYDYNVRLNLNESNFVYIDFKIDDKYIEVIDPESDLEKFKMIKKNFQS